MHAQLSHVHNYFIKFNLEIHFFTYELQYVTSYYFCLTKNSLLFPFFFFFYIQNRNLQNQYKIQYLTVENPTSEVQEINKYTVRGEDIGEKKIKPFG